MPLDAEQVLSRIVFVSVPENFGGESATIIDPHRLLPIEPPEGIESWNVGELSVEMILSGMLKLLAYRPDHEDSDYYRTFVLATRPKIITELTQAGITKASSREFDIAEEIFRALIGLEPANPRSVLNLALLLDQRAQAYSTLDNTELTMEYEEQAARWYQNALSLDEVLPETHLYAGYFYLRLSEVSRTIEQFRAFLEVSDDEEMTERVKKVLFDLERRNLSDELFKEAFDFIRLGQETEGLKRIDSFLVDHPEVWNAHFLRGWALRRTGQFAEGVECFRRAVELGGGTADTLNELAICLMETDQFSESRRALEKALEQEPENVKIISNLGILALKQQRQDEAAGFFKTVLEFDPADKLAHEYLRYIDEHR